ncbi:MAG: hypothetical protein QOE55_5890 [Acidobacteriaceae bacterium]|nr:hypothetical protein [Acidobacteriaceae bacterium]
MGVLKDILVGCTKTREIKKVTTSQDYDFVGACNIVVWMCRTKELKRHRLSAERNRLRALCALCNQVRTIHRKTLNVSTCPEGHRTSSEYTTCAWSNPKCRRVTSRPHATMIPL